MKKFVTILVSFVSVTVIATTAFANGADGSNLNRRALLKQVVSDVMLKGAISEAKKNGESCEASLVQAAKDNGGTITFEAQINCSVSPDEYTGGGTVLMINVKGRAFSSFLDTLVIKVDKAG